MTSAGPNQLLYTGSVARNGTSIAPVAGTVIVGSGQLPGGIYSLQVAGSYGGTADAIDNMELWINSDRMCSLPVTPVINGAPIWLSLPGVVIFEGASVQIKAVANGVAGSVFRGTIVATPVRTANLS